MRKIIIALFLFAILSGIISAGIVSIVGDIIKTHSSIIKLENDIKELKFEIDKYKGGING